MFLSLFLQQGGRRELILCTLTKSVIGYFYSKAVNIFTVTCSIYKRHTGHMGAALSVNITHGMFVTAEKIWPQGIFPDERSFPQTSRSVSVALAQQLFTFVLQIVCKEEHTRPR